MSIAQLVKELRERTGAGMMDCKKALEATESDMEKAVEWLRENGIAKAAKKGDRVAAEGLTSVRTNGNNAVVFELNSETDFVSKNDQFLALVAKIGDALVNSCVKTVEEALALEVNGETIELMTINGTASIGEKITLRRVQTLTKKDDQVFGTYMHNGGRISAINVMTNGTEDLAKQVSMHIASAKPMFLDDSSIDADTLEKEYEIVRIDAINDLRQSRYDKAYKEIAKTTDDAEERKAFATAESMKDDAIVMIDKIMPGKKNKHLKEICLLNNASIFDNKVAIKDYIGDASITDFACFEVGDGIEKVVTDFAAEVAAQANI
ncbi:MAG: translation elongation factor Ts [Mycoplasmatales bacterium]